MFEGDLTTLPTADLLESAAEHHAEANRIDARRLEHAQVYADRFHPSVCPVRPGRRPCDGRERAVVLGGEGCPEIAEFAVAEFAVVLGISPRVAADYLGQALALRHRFPFTWARVLAGEATPWKARQLAAACVRLPEDAAREVDRRVARLVDSITPYRLDKIIAAAKMHADPAGARAEAEEKARERGVFVGRSDGHGNKSIYIKAPAGAVIRHDATIAAIADALKTFGDTRGVQHRRADAVGIIADARYTEELLTQAHHHHHDTSPDTATAASATNRAPDTTTPASTDAPATTPNTTGTDATPDTIGAPDTTTPDTTTLDTTAANSTGADTAAANTTAPDTIAPGTTAPDAGQPESGDHGRHATNRNTSQTHGPIDHPAEPDHPIAPTGPVASAARRRAATDPGAGSGSWRSDVDPPDDPASEWHEPCPDDEADRDAPHPSVSDLPDPLDSPDTAPIESFDPFDPGQRSDPDDGDGDPLDAATQRALHARLARIKHDAHTNPTTTGGGNHTGASGGGRLRPGQAEIYVHLTDHTLATGTGVLRVEGLGPLLADQLAELVGHGPYTVKPVIDLNDAVSVDGYDIPDRIRERVKLTHPVEVFPFGSQETRRTMDLDHIQPYDPLGPPGQTSTDNLAPLGRFGHRVKTHARGWTVRRLDPKTLEWTTPHGFTFHVDPTGTHRQPKPAD